MSFLPDLLALEECWPVLAAVAVLASALGFVTGWIAMRRHEAARVTRASNSVAKLYDLAIERLVAAHAPLLGLERLGAHSLTPLQAEMLQHRRGLLAELLSRLALPKPREEPAIVKLPQRNKFKWNRLPVQPATGLPNRAAFEQNLAGLVQLVHQSQQQAGLLLIRVDRWSALQERFGATGAHTALKRISGLLCKTIRDEDLVCHTDEDVLAMLVLNADLQGGRSIAQFVRDTVRNHRFRLDNDGPEVLITCSLGYSLIRPIDTPEMVCDRARGALERSQSLGRNQLHVHDGAQLVGV